MKRILLLSILLLTAFLAGRTSPGIAQELLPAPVIIPDPQLEPASKCVIGGCSGELCADADKGPHFSICLWKEEYACLKHATCELQASGNCGWTYSDDYHACIGGGKSEPPSPTPTGQPACGNNVCETGEADESWCPPCTKGETICPMAPCYFYPGTCPSDCQTPKPTPDPTPCDKDTYCPLGMIPGDGCECRPLAISSDDPSGSQEEGSLADTQQPSQKTDQNHTDSPLISDDTGTGSQSEQQDSTKVAENEKLADAETGSTQEPNTHSSPTIRTDLLKQIVNFFRRFDIYLNWFF